MDQSVLRERIQEIVDFAKGESPYRSANKGWVTDDVYLSWSPTNEKDSTADDELVKVSFYWQPIIQVIAIIFVVICLATFFAFTPLAISKGKFKSISEMIDLVPTQMQVQQKNSRSVQSARSYNKDSEKTKNIVIAAPRSSSSIEATELDKTDNLRSSDVQTKGEVPLNKPASSKTKPVTAFDLFQTRYS